MNKYYGMITTSVSSKYTDHALSTFFANTKLDNGDKFFLIDNDNSFNKKIEYPIEIIKNPNQLSFAENVNQIIIKAFEQGKDVVMCNNDIIFTNKWSDNLFKKRDSIRIPNCNQYTTTYTENVVFKDLVELEDYLSHKKDLDIIVNYIINSKENQDQELETLYMPFYCFFLPNEILSKVGLFDIGFKPAGGEDFDYRLRALLKDFKTVMVKDSYLLHFQGKSTWAIPGAYESTIRKNARYREYFKHKWGQEVAKIFLQDFNYMHNIMIYDMIDLYNRNDFKNMLLQCMKLEGEVDVRKRDKA